MKNVEIEKEIDLLHNVCCVTGPMNLLLRALQRIVKAHINEEFWSINREFEANHKEMVLSDYWHNKPLRASQMWTFVLRTFLNFMRVFQM
jgi:hypothetical protein